MKQLTLQGMFKKIKERFADRSTKPGCHGSFASTI
jgi:hypothetical protein